MKRWHKILLAMLLGIAVIAPLLYRMLDRPMPQANHGPAARQAIQELEDVIGCQAWQQVGAVAWLFKGQRQHLWDRKRHFLRTYIEKKTVFLDLDSRKGWVFEGSRQVDELDAQVDLKNAWAWFINDSFWLNPFCSLSGPEVVHGLTTDEQGRPAILVTFESGGVTPGDSYLISLGPDGLPVFWRMWVQIIPLGGVPTTWSGWQQQQGVWFSTQHQLGPLSLPLEIKAASDLAELTQGEDPFADFEVAFRSP
ncbi:MAG: hypothetical protein H6510_05695 [Acidobacteria bacterium]|nr:hypothetical protein [Acidobacteriota bacterium]MCB9397286.1 hypothetical protein [Acidobacteriota bacterium]